MRPVRFTKAEHAEALAGLEWRAKLTVNRPGHGPEPTTNSKVASAAIEKLKAAVEPVAMGVAAGPLEVALIAKARGKVVELGSGPAYSKASKLATAVGATVADAELLGGWLSRQRWMTEPTTLLGVLHKWAEWLPRARATAPPPAAQEGFDGTATAAAGPPGPGNRGGGRGSAPGFG